MRESIRKDRARIQIGRISNFGLLEMTRQRLREGSIKWETQLSLGSFSQKIIKKIQHLAFTDKVKIIFAHVPEKIKLFIEKNFQEELDYFKKISFKVEVMSEQKLIIPEYKIELFNKSKKLINIIENINSIPQLKKSNEKFVNKKKRKKKKREIKKDKKILKKKKKRKKNLELFGQEERKSN